MRNDHQRCGESFDDACMRIAVEVWSNQYLESFGEPDPDDRKFILEFSRQLVAELSKDDPVATVLRDDLGRVRLVYLNEKNILDYVGANFYLHPLQLPELLTEDAS